MLEKDDVLRWRIASGWIVMLLVLAIMMEAQILESLFEKNEFRSLWVDPGPGGLRSMVFLVAIYALMPVYVAIVGKGARVLRWVAVAIASLALFFFVLHHVAHWYFGQRRTISSHVLDVTHHLVALWVIVNSVRWARLGAPATARLAAAQTARM